MMKRRVLWTALALVAVLVLAATNGAQAADQEESELFAVGPGSLTDDAAGDFALLQQAEQLQAEADAEAEADALIDQEQQAEGEADQETESEVAAEATAETDAETDAEAELETEQPAMLEMLVARGRGAKGGKQNLKRATGGRSPHGWGISANSRRAVQQKLPAARLTGAAATLTRANVRCVLCQFIAQKIKKGLQAAGEGEQAAALIESFSFASAGEQMRIQSAVEAAAKADAAAAAIPPMFNHGAAAPRRFRHTDVLASRASRARFTQVRANQPGEATDAARAAYLALYSSVYASFEGLCTQRMPLAYLPYCNDMLKSYRFFAQGLNYNDRAEQICMNGNFCDSRSYVRRVTHNAYQREPGDA